MIRINNLGPALVVAGTLVATLVAGPRVEIKVKVLPRPSRMEHRCVGGAIDQSID